MQKFSIGEHRFKKTTYLKNMDVVIKTFIQSVQFCECFLEYIKG